VAEQSGSQDHDPEDAHDQAARGAIVAPSRLSALPKVTMPVIVRAAIGA
jgi:hypothetical protein